MTSSGDYTFHVEQLSAMIYETPALLADNHEETGVFSGAFNPDYDRYLELAEHGDSITFTMRRGTRLVGLAVFFLDVMIQQKDQRVATQSINYVTPRHRGAGLAFMRFCDEALRQHGINCIWRNASTKFDISPIYERMGYELVEKSYLKRL